MPGFTAVHVISSKRTSHGNIVFVTCTAKHSRAEDIEMIDRNERQDNATQDIHHGWCHNEK